MAPRKRSLANRDLNGTNIIVVKNQNDTYYYYKMPNGDKAALGKDRKEAIETALILNKELRPAGNRAALILSGKHKAKPINNMGKIIEEFKKYFIPEHGWSERTLEGKNEKLKQYNEMWNHKGATEIKTAEIAKFLNPMTTAVYQKHRALLIQLFGFAIHQGHLETNPVSPTMHRKAKPRVRKRHTLEGYNTIYKASPEWLQRAMEIALLTLQRRYDLVNIHIQDHIDIENKTIKILQSKSKNYKKPVYIEIKMGDALYKAVMRCIKSDVPCPFLIHYRPGKINQLTKNKLHPFAVTPNHLTKMFGKYRDLSGAYNHLPKEQRPSLHDLRALGAWLYEKQGFSNNYIKALTGHTSQAMLDHYIEGHEPIKPVQVHADLENIIKS